MKPWKENAPAVPNKDEGLSTKDLIHSISYALNRTRDVAVLTFKGKQALS